MTTPKTTPVPASDSSASASELMVVNELITRFFDEFDIVVTEHGISRADIVMLCRNHAEADRMEALEELLASRINAPFEKQIEGLAASKAAEKQATLAETAAPAAPISPVKHLTSEQAEVIPDLAELLHGTSAPATCPVPVNEEDYQAAIRMATAHRDGKAVYCEIGEGAPNRSPYARANYLVRAWNRAHGTALTSLYTWGIPTSEIMNLVSHRPEDFSWQLAVLEYAVEKKMTAGKRGPDYWLAELAKAVNSTDEKEDASVLDRSTMVGSELANWAARRWNTRYNTGSESLIQLGITAQMVLDIATECPSKRAQCLTRLMGMARERKNALDAAKTRKFWLGKLEAALNSTREIESPTQSTCDDAEQADILVRYWNKYGGSRFGRTTSLAQLGITAERVMDIVRNHRSIKYRIAELEELVAECRREQARQEAAAKAEKAAARKAAKAARVAEQTLVLKRIELGELVLCPLGNQKDGPYLVRQLLVIDSNGHAEVGQCIDGFFSFEGDSIIQQTVSRWLRREGGLKELGWE